MKYTDPKYYFPQMFMTEEAYATQAMVHDFVDKEIMPVRHLIDDDVGGKIVGKIRQGLADIGVQRMLMPKEYGGDGMGTVVNCVVGEELARGDAGIAMTLSCTNWAWAPAKLAVNRAVLDKFMPDFCGDKVRIACFNMTEPGGSHGGGGCDIENPHFEGRKLRTIARLEGDEWVINGSKLWATNSGEADLYCNVCTTDPDLGLEGIVFIYVPYPWEGLTRGKSENKTGYRSDQNCAIYLDNVRVPREWGIGPGPEAARIFCRNLLTPKNSAYGAGLVRGAFETLLEFTGQRIVGDKPIRQHSLGAKVIADMAITLETLRLLYLSTAYMIDHPEIYGPIDEGFMPTRISISKVYGAAVAEKVIGEAMNLMGSYGYVRENHIEKYWRDAKLLPLVLGGVNLNRFNVCRGYYDLDL